MSDIDLASFASPEGMARARKIKLFLMDVDGILSDGGDCLISTFAAIGSTDPIVSEMKVFNTQARQGLSLAHTMGIQTAFITGRSSPAVAKRADERKVTYVYLGQAKKTAAYEECMAKGTGNRRRSCLYGRRPAGHSSGAASRLAVCVADGAPELKAVCHFTTRQLAGKGLRGI